jgi:cytochrome c oxidase cbb3-type subunit III
MPARRAALLFAALLAASAACDREKRQVRMTLPEARRVHPIRLNPLQPGKQLPAATAGREYTENAYQVSQGQRLFGWYNCSGCHANGGGGMGPPLMDDFWIYGNDPANVYASIVEGRPNGMPSFGGHIPDSHLWQLVAYVKSLDPERPIGEPPGPRRDDMQASEGRHSR